MSPFYSNRLVRVIAPLWFLLGCAMETAAVRVTAQAEPSRDPLYGSLDKSGVKLAQETVQSALEQAPSHSTRRWREPSTGISGSVTPRRTFKIKTGHYCRDFEESVMLNGKVTSERRTACRTSDGHWLVVER